MEKEYLYPVTKEELNALFNSYHNGSGEAREKIILLYIPLTYKYVEEYFSFYNCDINDLKSVATIGLIKAVDTYHDKNGLFYHYLYRVVSREVLYHITKEKKFTKEESIEEFKTCEDGTVISDFTTDIIDKTATYEMLDTLKPKERQALELYYIYSIPQLEIAKILGVKQGCVSKNLNSALTKIQEEFNLKNVKKPNTRIRAKNKDQN